MEGIEKWWLPQTRGYGLADIRAALADLEKRNLIRVWESASAEAIYGRHSDDPSELEDYLANLE